MTLKPCPCGKVPTEIMNEAELKEWMHGNEEYFSKKGSNCPTYYVQSLKIEQLFAGKKLVDAGAVVLSRATADWMLKHLQEGLTSYAREHLGEAIEQARGKNNGQG